MGTFERGPNGRADTGDELSDVTLREKKTYGRSTRLRDENRQSAGLPIRFSEKEDRSPSLATRTSPRSERPPKGAPENAVRAPARVCGGASDTLREAKLFERRLGTPATWRDICGEPSTRNHHHRARGSTLSTPLGVQALYQGLIVP